MPTYEYICGDCNKEFSVLMSMAEHDSAAVSCRQCGSKKVTQQYSTFFAVTSRKS